jgi:hypothetical protein
MHTEFWVERMKGRGRFQDLGIDGKKDATIPTVREARWAPLSIWNGNKKKSPLTGNQTSVFQSAVTH